MRLLFFNPENDLALASNDPHYTPPASALQMAADLELLPLRWAGDGDFILLRDGSIRACEEASGGKKGCRSSLIHSSLLTLHSSLSNPNSSFITRHSSFSLLPWGWSPLLVRQLRDWGVPQELLPTEAELSDYRDYASRATAVRLLSRLRDEWAKAFADGWIVGESTWCTTESDVIEAIERYGSRAMLKAPWSGSGRGVHPVQQSPIAAKTQAWIRRTLERQGGVEVEPYYEKVQDLAFEFWAEAGSVRYEGLSIFETTAGGVYAGNLVANEEEKERRLAQYVALTLVDETRERLEALLSASGLPCWYNGPLGIDLMIVKNQGADIADRPAYSLHPLVEINLRMTMGWVALQLKNELPDDEMGVFCIRQQAGRYEALLTENK
ncbi:MAG: hypothetical protein IJJ94_02055 [Bacteroidaceae bacterium]|nr:hypothetical protein [Bacteroidaceae bacterium]